MITRQEAYSELSGKGSEFRADTNVLFDVNPLNGEITEITDYAEIDAEVIRLQAAYPLKALRLKRDALLAETDWWASSDLTMSAKRKSYRQALRDLPKGLTTEELVNNVTWPPNPA